MILLVGFDVCARFSNRHVMTKNNCIPGKGFIFEMPNII